MTFGSLFAGIGGFDEALQRCGYRSAWAAENNRQCNSVRRRHFTDERTIECVTAVSGPGFGVDIITAGWPCQGNSVAGRRAGMADKRSGLWSEVNRVIAEQRPKWFLGENVPGILSVCGCRLCSALSTMFERHRERQYDRRRCKCSRCLDGRRLRKAHRGRDFFGVLADLAELGYGTAYRILDAQWWGVPQRRRRVFVVGYLGDWRRAAQILFESKSLPWDPPPSRETGAEVAATVRGGTESGSNEHGNKIATGITCRYRKGTDSDATDTLIIHTLRAEGFDASEDGTGRGTPLVPVAYRTSGNSGVTEQGDRTAALNTATDPTQNIVAYQCHGSNVGEMGTVRNGNQGVTGGVPFLQTSMAVRRLTPRECERLQGFPDDWSRYGENGEEIADGPRYRMLGNAVAIPVVEWIGKRI